MKNISIKVFFILMMRITLSALGIIFYFQYQGLVSLRNHISEYIEETDQWSYEQSHLMSAIGYGRMIHNFKNLILRRDRRYHDTLVVTYNDFLESSSHLMELPHFTEASKQALNTLKHTMKNYRENADLVLNGINENLSIYRADVRLFR